MRLKHIIANSNPTFAYMYDPTSTKFINLLGSGNIGPATAPTTKTGLTYNGPEGALLATTNKITLSNTGLAIIGKSNTPWTVEVVGYPQGASELFTRFSTGLFYTGSAFEFRIQFASGIETVSYTAPQQSAHLVGVYAVNKMLLYMNGDLVGSKDISSHGDFSDSGSNWSGPNNNPAIISLVALYRRALTDAEIKNHWIEPEINMYGALFSSSRFTASNLDRKITLDKTWQAEDWRSGTFTSGSVNDTAMTLTSGTWTGVIPAQGDTTRDLKLSWDGTATASVFTNVTSSSSVPDNGLVALTPGSVIPVKTQLTFTSIDNFRVTGYADRYLYATNTNRQIYNDAGSLVTGDSTHPLRMDSTKNMYLPPGQIATVLADTNGIYAVNTGAVEMWINTGSTARTVASLIDTGGTGWVNGVLGTNLPANVWVHVVVNKTLNNAGFNIYGEAWIAYIALHEAQRNITDALNLYNNWIGVPRLTVQEAMVAITEDTPPTKLYSSVWTPVNQ